MNGSREEVIITLIISTALILLLSAVVVAALFIQSKRKYQHQVQLSKMQGHYEKSLLQARLSLLEETYRAISQNLHDNIGSNIATAMLFLHNDNTMSVSEQEANRKEALRIFNGVIDDLRDVAHSLNPDYLDKIGLKEAIKQRMDQLAKTKKYVIELHQPETEPHLNKQKQVVLFYIFQEALNNINSHSQAKKVIVQTRYETDHLTMMIKDDGIGIYSQQSEFLQRKGTGLLNMKNHAELIGASLNIASETGKGTEITVLLPHPCR